jgi:hypothetical protein
MSFSFMFVIDKEDPFQEFKFILRTGVMLMALLSWICNPAVYVISPSRRRIEGEEFLDFFYS